MTNGYFFIAVYSFLIFKLLILKKCIYHYLILKLVEIDARNLIQVLFLFLTLITFNYSKYIPKRVVNTVYIYH